MITALNGRLPSTTLTVADTGPNGPQRLRTDAAASWARMLAAGMPRGHLRSGYRTLTQQEAERAASPTGALPAGRSQHGEGLAADVDEPARSWVRIHGLPYGWRIGFVPGEPWHAQYDRTDQHPAPPAPPVQPVQEDDMPTPLIWRRNDGAAMILTPEGPQVLTFEQWQVWVNLLGDGAGNITPPGMYSMDPRPFDVVTGSLTLDRTAQIVAGVVAALPAGGVTAAQIADELAKRLAQ